MSRGLFLSIYRAASSKREQLGYNVISEWAKVRQEINYTNLRMHLSHIPQCSIQNRNGHISVLNEALWDMEQAHSGICELGQLYTQHAQMTLIPPIVLLLLVPCPRSVSPFSLIAVHYAKPCYIGPYCLTKCIMALSKMPKYFCLRGNFQFCGMDIPCFVPLVSIHSTIMLISTTMQPDK